MRLSTQELRQPVSEDLPCGENLEYDPVFQKMELLMEDTAAEQQFGDTIIPGSPPDWKRVAKQVDNLNKRTRDLRVLTNGALADLGLKGLKAFSESLESLNTCLEVFWDNIHPQLDADEGNNDAIQRISCLQLMNDYAIVNAGLVWTPLFKVRGLGTISLRDINMAEGKTEPVGDERVLDIGLIQGAFAKADAKKMSTLSEGVRGSIAQIKRTEEICRHLATNTCGPDFWRILKVLGEISKAVNRYAPAAAVKLHNNGQLESKANYINYKLEGLFRLWYSNGQLESEANYINGQNHGVFRRWYNNGQLKSEANYIIGKLEGLFRLWYSNGQLESEANYINGEQEGLFRLWYNNGQIKSEENYINFELEGLFRWWYNNGQIKSEENYIKRKREGLGREWYRNGQLESEANYVDGELEGLDRKWYDNGQPWMERNHVNGELEGLFRWWYSNGQLRSEANFVNGKREGLDREWYSRGQLKSEANYINGKREGLDREWYRNGQLKSEANYINGKQEGLARSWYENGQLESEENSVDGVKVE